MEHSALGSKGGRGIVDFIVKRYGEGEGVSSDNVALFSGAADCFFSPREKIHGQCQLL